MKYPFILLMAIVSLTGCVTTKTNTVTVVKNVFVEVPSELTQSCTATAPISEQEYELLTPYNKEYWLTGYAALLLKDVAVCNDRVTKIDKWNKEQAKIFSNQVKEEQDALSKRSESTK